MSEYDAGSLPPICPTCGEWQTIRWVDCPDLATDTLGGDGEEGLCPRCDGSGGWFACSCGYTDERQGAPPETTDAR